MFSVALEGAFQNVEEEKKEVKLLELFQHGCFNIWQWTKKKESINGCCIMGSVGSITFGA